MQRKSTVVSIKKTTGSNSAHRIIKTHTRAPVASQQSGDFAPSNSSKKAIEESIQLKRAAEDNGRTIKCPEDNRKHSSECSDTDCGQAFEQAQVSMLPGEMGEKRLAYNAVVIKINNKKMMPSSPEGPVTLSSLPIPSSPSLLPTLALHLAYNEAMSMPTAIDQDYMDDVSKKEGMSADKHLPDAKVAPILPTHPPATPTWAAALRQPLDKASPPIEVAPRRSSLCVVNTKPLPSDACLPAPGTARRQSEHIKMPSMEGEGIYLSRAAAYIQERMNRRSLACDAFVP